MKQEDMTVAQFTAIVRRELIKRTGTWPMLVKLSREGRREPRLSYRWLVSVAGEEKASHDMARLFELCRVMGITPRLGIDRPNPSKA